MSGGRPEESGEDRIILLVDDYADTREVLARLLRAEGYWPISVKGPLDAIEFMVKTPPALVISDIKMPGMDGLSFCERIRSDPRWTGVRVVLFSVEEATRGAALRAGADAFIQKDSMDWAVLRMEILRLIGPGTLGKTLPNVRPPGVQDAG